MREARGPEAARIERAVPHWRVVDTTAVPAPLAGRIPAIGDHRGRPFRRRGRRAGLCRFVALTGAKEKGMEIRTAAGAAALALVGVSVAHAQPTEKDCM